VTRQVLCTAAWLALCQPWLASSAVAQSRRDVTAARMSVAEAALLTWRTETRSAGITALRRILSDDPENGEARFELGRVLTWDIRTRVEGVAMLRQIIGATPERLDADEALAEVLSWDDSTRAEAIVRLRALVERAPARTSARLRLAEVLAWNPATRDESRTLYLGVLEDDGQSIEATIGLARLLAWSGRVAESRAWYELALTRNPSNSTARVGMAELAGWGGRARASLKTLAEFPAGTIETPDAIRLRAAAYSQVGRPARALEQYGKLLALEPNNGAALQAARSLRRRLRPVLEMAAESSAESGDPATARVDTSAVPLRFAFHPGNGDTEVSVLATMAAYRNSGGSSRDRSTGAGIDAPVGNRVRLSGDIVSHEFGRGERTFTGRGQFQMALTDNFDVRLGTSREQLSASRLSLGGEESLGVMYGPAVVNQLQFGVGARPGRGWDVWGHATVGRIGGTNIADNMREEVFAGAGKSFHPGAITLRPGYTLAWMSYDLDLGGFPSTDTGGDGINRPGVGGYFAPSRFLNQMVRLDTTVPLGGAFLVVGGAGVGRQQVEESTSRDFSRRVTSSDAYLGIRMQAGDRLSLGSQLTYQDVASDFDRTVLRITMTYGF
jgi:tetratricopeptide (TPR) repeat protein